jgi:hypothetical protein
MLGKNLCLGLMSAAVAASCAPEEEAPLVALEETYAGRAEDEQTFLAVIRSGTSFSIYACDDDHMAWFGAESFASPMELTNDAGDSLLLAIDGEHAIGELDLAATDTPVAFELDATDEEVLYRAEGALAGERLLGGWIRLPDGEQRGTVLRGAQTTGVSRVVIDSTVRIEGPFSNRLAPAAFTPRTIQAPTRLRASHFGLFAMGDSYGAGEGAPERPGDYLPSGNLERDGQREIWDESLDEVREREARGCHRSGVSGVEVAADLLRAEYMGALSVGVQSYACSGATTEHVLDCPYRGAVGDHFDEDTLQPPQIERLRASSGDVDALYMSVGGNDMRFGYLMSDCLAGDCGPGSPIESEFFAAVARMPARYRSVAESIDAIGLPRERVYISQYPNPLVDAGGDPCDEVDTFRYGGIGVIEGEDVEWAADEIHASLNEAVADAADANDWTLVSAHVDTFVGHGYCTSDRWFHDNPSSLLVQGNHMSDSLRACDFPIDECIAPSEVEDEVCFPRFFLDPGRYPTIGGSIVHPNHDGYAQGYAPAIADAMRDQVEDHIRPAPVANLRIQAQARTGTGGVTIAWDDRASTETEYRVVVTYTSGTGLPPMDRVTHPADTRAHSIPLSVAAAGTISVTPCFVGPRPARREVCGDARTIQWTNTRPRRAPTGVAVDTSRSVPILRERLEVPQQLIRVVWTAPSLEPAIVYYELEITNGDASVRRLASASTSFVANAELATVAVRACNFVGCGDASMIARGPGCARGHVLSPTGSCVPGNAPNGLDPRDLQCAGVTNDPGGVCAR